MQRTNVCDTNYGLTPLPSCRLPIIVAAVCCVVPLYLPTTLFILVCYAAWELHLSSLQALTGCSLTSHGQDG